MKDQAAHAGLGGGGPARVVMGLALSAAGAQILETFLFGLHATDAMTFAAVAVLLCIVAMLASYLPARRAAGLDPLRALRHE